MSVSTYRSLSTSRNLQKHSSSNPLQRWLLGRFHEKIARLVALALAKHSGQGRDSSRLPLVLDVGCGEGFVAAFLTQRLDGIQLLGIDSRPEALTFARRQGLSGVKWLAADALSIPLRDDSVPVILCLEVLEHLPDPWSALQEIQRVCSGSVILSVPNQPFFALANLLRGKNLRTLGDDPEHLFHWSARSFLRQVRPRLAVTRVEYAFPWTIVVGQGKPA